MYIEQEYIEQISLVTQGTDADVDADTDGGDVDVAGGDGSNGVLEHDSDSAVAAAVADMEDAAGGGLGLAILVQDDPGDADDAPQPSARGGVLRRHERQRRHRARGIC